MSVSRLEPVPLREVWINEERDFTPWLEKNIDILGEVLEIESLSVVEREGGTGTFEVDLLAEDSNSEKVIIENQFGKRSLIFSTSKGISVEMGRYDEVVYRTLSDPVTPNEVAKKLGVTQKTAQRFLMHLALTKEDVKYRNSGRIHIFWKEDSG